MNLRSDYRELSEEEKKLIKEIKDIGQELMDKYELIEPGEGRDNAKRRLLESIFWASRMITK